ncbi:zinc finger CCHC domain-containing protein 8-like isoform X2 [Phalaenopsis equestris]|uniref:zinc finger CCHC domain-containing protein 8-like isoform X2 n=1 Tax=Phalaenopsis equestris TaxID=78828 RepID=UPI0009E1BE0B|nr:zinc finger CCHC domain-containing protein 8-like isoform X2 [Phalaenopsis equestris]
MGSDDFIKLDSPSNSDDQAHGNGCHEPETQESSFSIFKEKVDDVNHIETEGFTDGSNIEAHIMNVEEEGCQLVLDMDLEDDDVLSKRAILQENVQFSDSFSTLERVDVSESKFSTNIISTSSVSHTTMTKLVVDESPVAGFKRARTTCDDQHPSVRVVYNCLTRESKKKLMELMQQWSQWQTKHQSSCNVPENVALESGEDTYYAALNVGSGRTNAVSFWLDSQGIKENIGDPVKLDGDMVPLYDRGFSLGLTTLDGSTITESGVQALDASRCFNCGSYSHSVKECPKPRDNVAISNARKQHGSKRNQNASSRSQNRYYQKTSGKFDDLKAGVLGPETRECLGIGELDPPPWLHRMRQLGYPPGYLDEVEEDRPSGIVIFADEEVDAECEEGELPDRADPTPSKKRMTVEFPGINAPIPENADNWVWATSRSSHNQNSHTDSNQSHRGSHRDRIESTDWRDDGPPGSAHGLAAFSRAAYSPRFSSRDHNSTPSPHLGRSLSDRSWPSPTLYGNSPIHSPHSSNPYSSHNWQSPQHHGLATYMDHRSYENLHRSNYDARERDQHRHEHHRHHPRR